MEKIKKALLGIVAAALLIAAALCLLGYKKSSTLLLSQQAAERWQGDNSIPFAQISCFTSAGDDIRQEEIFKFRSDMLSKLIEASFEVSADTSLIHDAWCGFGQATVSRGQRSGKVSVTHIGGGYFDFHPIKLVNGAYLSPDDLMGDRVLLDRETAWLLFGGEELAGMSFEIEGQPFYVAGVVERENDRFSTRAYDGGMGIYMHHEAYAALKEDAAITCYELVMAEPVAGFVHTAAEEKFPIGSGEIIDNTYRFAPERMLSLLKSGSSRSMHLGAAVYPYWENAARAAEDACLKWLCAAMVLVLLPAVVLAVTVIKTLLHAKQRLEDDFIPDTKEKLSEAIRIRARKRWEKKHPERR